MPEHILVINAGSSSLKFGMYEHAAGAPLELVAKGLIERIRIEPRLAAKNSSGDVLIDELTGTEPGDQRAALEHLANWLATQFDRESLVAVGHRVVHGGQQFDRPTLVTADVVNELESLSPLAPLHQPFNLAAIQTVAERMPDLPQVACFDTAFHRGHDAVADLMALPQELRARGLQRYGFHGLSYEYIASVLPELAPDIASGRVIVAHLGSGASLCALDNGRSIDSTLGFTALDGLCMGTRPGALDPGVVLYLFQELGMSAEEVEEILYKKSGLLGISGVSNDMRTLLASDEPSAALAVDYFVYRAAKEIGALAAVLDGLDALVFTAGIGENSVDVRQRICDACGWLGLKLDAAANEAAERRISTPDSAVSAWVIPTNEELMIARHTAALLGARRP